jgi:ATP-binding cassette subfamily B protein
VAQELAPRRVAHARRELLGHVLSGERIGRMWLVRAPASASFAGHVARAGGVRRSAVFLGATVAQVALGVLAWLLLGKGALSGVVEPAWLAAWALVSLSAIAAQLVGGAASGRLSIDVAALLKQRLLAGALALDANAIRARGSGQLLAMVSESEAIESAGLAGALGALSALVQLASAALVLAAGAGGLLHAALLVAWSAFVAWLAARFAKRRAAWTERRFALADSFVENVVGNRTRVAQQRPDDRHRLEDAALDAYAGASRSMDAAFEPLVAAPSRGWLALGLLGLVPAMLAARPDPLGMAVTLAGILQAQGAFAALVASLPSLLGAAIAWRSVGPLFHAATRAVPSGAPEVALAAGAPSAPSASRASPRAAKVLEARGVAFRYREGAEPVIRGVDLTVHRGERLLLEGPSGGGKSTLAGLVAGVHTPSSGLVLLRGLDRATVGATSWRRRVASAPQFHENLLLSGTLAFNLLMGRQWPASPDERRDAEALCRRLGLGPMLDRMPSGLDQVVGETGWQLSHGERSRVFLARALLQRSDLVVLDESFGALDPLTLRTCLDTVLEQAPTLVVIAHP